MAVATSLPVDNTTNNYKNKHNFLILLSTSYLYIYLLIYSFLSIFVKRTILYV